MSCPAPERRKKNPPHNRYEVVDIHLRSSCGNLPPELAPCVWTLVAGLLRADPSTTLDERRVYSLVGDDHSNRFRVRQHICRCRIHPARRMVQKKSQQTLLHMTMARRIDFRAIVIALLAPCPDIVTDTGHEMLRYGL